MPADYTTASISKCVCVRAVVIFVPVPVVEQWSETIIANLPTGHALIVVDADDPRSVAKAGGPQDVSDASGVRRHRNLKSTLQLLERVSRAAAAAQKVADLQPTVLLVAVNCNTGYDKSALFTTLGDFSHLALGAVVVDEAPLVMTQMKGRHASNMRWPPVLRTILLTAQPTKLLESKAVGPCSATFLKLLIFHDPSACPHHPRPS